MDLDDLKYFQHLAKTLHFGKTAKDLGMSASALTRRIQGMEAELGTNLFIRGQRQVQLSEAGSVFRSFAKRQAEQWEELRVALHGADESPTGDLNVACTVTACHTILPTLLRRFRERYPRVTLRLLTQDAARSRGQLEAGELDLAVIPTEPNETDGLVVQPLAETKLVFVAPAEPRQLDGLSESPGRRKVNFSVAPLVAPIGGLERRRLDAWLSTRKVAPRIVAEVRGNEGILAMVALGSGIGLVPELVLASSPLQEKLRVLPQLTPPPGYQVSLCARPNALKRRSAEAFWQLASEALE